MSIEKLTLQYRPQIAGEIHKSDTLQVSIVLIPTWLLGNQAFIKTIITEGIGEEAGSGVTFESEFLTQNEAIHYLEELIGKEIIIEETAQQFMMSI